MRTLSWEFDAAGQMTDATDPAATYGYTFDGLGRPTDQSQSFAGFSPLIVYESTFDAASNRTLLEASIGGTADFENAYIYDDLHRLTRLIQEDQSGGNAVAEKRFDFTYNANGQYTKLASHADVAGTEFVANTLYTYDNIGRLKLLLHTFDATVPSSGWGTDPLAGYKFVYDVASHISSIDSYIDGLSEFDYDNTSQLIGADHNSQGDETYTYDANGNRNMTGHTTGDNNQLTSDGTFNYTYDDEGNRATRTHISTQYITEYSWDHRNRLTKVTEKDDQNNVLSTVEYKYDIHNRLIRRTHDADGPGGAAAADAFFSWLDDQIALEFDGTTASDLAHRNVWDPNAIDQILAVEDISSLATPGDVIHALTDHLGTPRDLAEYDSTLNETTIENHREFNSFGELIGQTNASFTINIGFTGVYSDIITGLNYHRARWYDPLTGRWTAEDPMKFVAGDTNLLRYVANTPTINRDPTGLYVFKYGPYTQDEYAAIGMGTTDAEKYEIEVLIQLLHLFKRKEPWIFSPRTVYWGGHCHTWVYDFKEYNFNKVGSFKSISLEDWELMYNGYIPTWVDHHIIKVKLSNGTFFYIDNFTLGGADRIFFEIDPAYLFPGTPEYEREVARREREREHAREMERQCMESYHRTYFP